MEFASNDFLEISARNAVGELMNIKSKKTGIQYLWNGDPNIWEYRAPIVFPVAGGLVNDQYKLDGKIYGLEKHGFIRHSIFDVIESGKDRIVYQLKETTETKKIFPFDFTLTISYVLDSKKVRNIITVENRTNSTMFFSIGGHPAFMCPMNENEVFSDYYIEFDKPVVANQMLLSDVGMFTRKEKVFLNNEKRINLTHAMFENDAIFLKDFDCSLVHLKSDKSDNYISVEFDGFPCLGIWTKVGAPYVCIEPWHGHGDFDDFDGEISEKSGIVSLEQGETFNSEFIIEIHD